MLMSMLMMGMLAAAGNNSITHHLISFYMFIFNLSGKMMATMGLGGVGALAAKALGVSMMALMLAGIVGLKKLAEGGGDGGHSVHYVCIHYLL